MRILFQSRPIKWLGAALNTRAKICYAVGLMMIPLGSVMSMIGIPKLRLGISAGFVFLLSVLLCTIGSFGMRKPVLATIGFIIGAIIASAIEILLAGAVLLILTGLEGIQ